MLDALNLIVANIGAASAGLVPIIYTLLAASGLDIVSGTWASWKSGTYNAKFLPEFIKSHIVMKVAPILLVLLAGIAAGGTSSAAGIATVTAGGVAALAYLESMRVSILSNIAEGKAGTKGLPSSVEIKPIVISTAPLTEPTDPK